nr:type I secretion C-terminal target domain-containing protein [Halomonas stenophila]
MAVGPEFRLSQEVSGQQASPSIVELAGGSLALAYQEGNQIAVRHLVDLNQEIAISKDITGTEGNDTLIGSDVADTLDGASGDDSLTGGAGDDTLTGGTGNNRFIFEPVDDLGVDTLLDFTMGSGEDADVLVVAPLLQGYDPQTSTLADFVQVREENGDSVVSVDRDGAGEAYAAEDVAVLVGVSGIDADALLANQNLELL